ncbi:MAG: hypothetical protein ACFFAN_07850 [Promethearchaeota archaeon]
MSVPEAYPIGYRTGFDMMLWYINFFVSLIIFIIFLIRALKTKFINKKKLYFGNFFMALGISFTHILFQMAYNFPDMYNLYVASGYISTFLGLTIFIYFWEKNIIKLKFIPTIFCFILSCFIIVNFLYNLTFQQQLIEFISILVPLGGIMAFLALILVLFKFSQKVIGKLRYFGYLVIVSIISYAIGYTLDTYYAFELIPNLSPIISPVVVLISTLMFFYGVNKIFDGLLLYYQKTHICIVHKGKILQNDFIYLCPNCNAIYCRNCYEKVIKSEGCWNCFELFKIPKEIKENYKSDSSKMLKEKYKKNSVDIEKENQD